MAQSSSSSSNADPMAGAVPSAQAAEKQQADGSWPSPGDEGYVHPDGTPQAAEQLAMNRQAAAERAAAGSTVHGAPSPARGGNPDAAAIAAKRAEAYSGQTPDERDAALTEGIRTGQAEQVAAAERAAGQQTTDDSKPKTTR